MNEPICDSPPFKGTVVVTNDAITVRRLMMAMITAGNGVWPDMMDEFIATHADPTTMIADIKNRA
jgi:hypothetical protein